MNPLTRLCQKILRQDADLLVTLLPTPTPAWESALSLRRLDVERLPNLIQSYSSAPAGSDQLLQSISVNTQTLHSLLSARRAQLIQEGRAAEQEIRRLQASLQEHSEILPSHIIDRLA